MISLDGLILSAVILAVMPALISETGYHNTALSPHAGSLPAIITEFVCRNTGCMPALLVKILIFVLAKYPCLRSWVGMLVLGWSKVILRVERTM